MTGASMLPPLGATQFGQTMEPPEPSAALAAKREVDRIEEEQRDAENQINFMKRKEETMKQQIKHKKKAQTQIFAVREEREKERAERIQVSGFHRTNLRKDLVGSVCCVGKLTH